MDKEEILQKSREENAVVDERERRDQWRVGYVMLTVILFVWAVLFIWDSSHGVDTSGLQGLMLSSIVAMSVCNYRKTGLRQHIVFGVLAGFGVVCFFVSHIMMTM